MTAMPPQRLSGWRQFWVLFWFQALNSPRLLRVPLYVGLIFFNDIMSMVLLPADVSMPPQTFYSNLSVLFLASLLLLNTQTFFVPRSVSKRYFPATHQWMELSGGFLLTRAVDRRLIHRSMTLLMYLLVLAVPFAIWLASLRHSGLRLSFYRNDGLDSFLQNLPGSTLIVKATGQNYGRSEIFVPHGRTLVTEWHLWAYFVGMLTVQLIFLIDKFKRLGWIMKSTVPKRNYFQLSYLVDLFKRIDWMKNGSLQLRNLIVLLGELILIVVLFALVQNRSLFFVFIAHQTAFWLLMVPTMILGQLCCERLFARLEQG